MSTLRKRFRVVVNGEPLEVTTNARDLVGLEGGDEDDKLGGFRLVYAALHRTGQTGLTLDEFLDVLDELEADPDDAEPNGTGTDDLDPTHPAGSASAP